jgi:hypothetical protein
MEAASTTNAAQRCWLIASLLGMSMVGLMPQSASAHAVAPAARVGRAVVLQTFRAGQFVLDLAIATCRRSECPIEVRLRAGSRVVDRVTLPVAAGSQHVKAEIVDAVWGADAGLKAWANGKENDYVATGARMLRLAPRTTALLVSQQYGFEHLKRNHLVIVPRADKLSIAWKAEEGAGPTWSATQVIGGQGGKQHEIAYLRGFYEPEEDAADRLDVARLRWDEASARLRETALPARDRPLYLLDLGTHDTAAQARQARSANFCLSPYWVLDASRFRAGEGGKATIGMLYASRALAEKAASDVNKCLPDATVSVETWTGAP